MSHHSNCDRCGAPTEDDPNAPARGITLGLVLAAIAWGLIALGIHCINMYWH